MVRKIDGCEINREDEVIGSLNIIVFFSIKQ